MLPEDVQDLVLAFILLVILVILGSIFQLPRGIKGDEFIYVSDELRDEEEMFFLNFLRTDVNGKSVADLIILGKDDNNLERKLKEEIKKIEYFDFDYEYGLRIIYPDESFREIGCTSEIEEKGIKMELPFLDDQIIRLQFAFRGGECLQI